MKFWNQIWTEIFTSKIWPGGDYLYCWSRLRWSCVVAGSSPPSIGLKITNTLHLKRFNSQIVGAKHRSWWVRFPVYKSFGFYNPSISWSYNAFCLGHTFMSLSLPIKIYAIWIFITDTFLTDHNPGSERLIKLCLKALWVSRYLDFHLWERNWWWRSS